MSGSILSVIFLFVLPLLAFAVLAGRAVAGVLRLFDRKGSRWIVMTGWKPLWIASLSYLVLLGGSFAYAFLLEPEWVVVERGVVRTETAVLGKSPFRILHLSDLHLEGPLGARERFALKEAAEGRPDLVLLTGDYVNTRDALPALRELLDKLHFIAPDRVFGIDGHADHKFDVASVFAASKTTLLRDDFVRIAGAGRELVVVGQALHPVRSAKELLETAPEGAYRIAMHHEPGAAAGLEGAEIDLFVCGHTHGRQLPLPFIRSWFETAGLPSGMSVQGRMTVVVSRGLGMSGGPAPRARFLSRPEIRWIEVVGKP